MTSKTLITIAFFCTAGLANAACSFVSLLGQAPSGQLLENLTEAASGRGYQRLPDEGFWTFEKEKFESMAIVAPSADLIGFGTYKGIIFQSNIKYATRNLKSTDRDLERELDACAKKIAAECWEDDSGAFYEVTSNAEEAYLYITYPSHASPIDPDIPPKPCR